MSGHSHFAGIKHRKGINDSKRARIFTKLAKPITIAAQEGGGNPATNFKLRMAIDKAREFNMPKDNIDRAIKRGTGELKGEQIQEIIYEVYGPGGIMIIIKTLTDNKNRTVSEIKTILNKFGGKLGGSGSVMWNFRLENMEYKPQNTMEVDENIKSQYEKLLEALDEQDDVDEIYDNL
ncbi:MAG: YebC/PmpR family DNA-binding transcriptional regulator [Parcubacteria group bacterium]|jgi:YebC/PmpR family DNA-binding regulatory protein